MHFQILRAIEYLNDPCIQLARGNVCILWVCETEKQVQDTMQLVIECLHEFGAHGLVWLELNFKIDQNVVIKYTDEHFIYQIANNNSLTDDTGRSKQRSH